ncbi:MAG: sialidase family protein, partial [Mycobacteriales bacterium]
ATARPAATGAPSAVLACSTSTGYAAAESHVTVLRDGTVVYTPAVLPQGTLGIGQVPGDVAPAQSNASPAALATSRDGGRTWRLVRPDGATWNPTDHGDYVDPVTGRWFFESYGPIPVQPAYGTDQEGPSHILVSPDDGRTWKHSVIRDTQVTENAQFTAAPPPTGGDLPTGYPRVSYYCANLSVGFTSPLIAQRACYRSLDGGLTWAKRSVILSSNAPVHPECGVDGENLSAIDGSYPQPGPGGALYLMVACGSHTYLARSTDEALTFPVLRGREGPRTVPVTAKPFLNLNTSALQVLSDGTLVVVSLENGRLLLRCSGDEGRTWTPPVDVTAPGLPGVASWAIASRGTTIALAYLAHHPDDPRYYGYVAQVRDPRTVLRTHRTTVVTGQVRAAPLLFGDSQSGGPGITGAGTVSGPGGTHLPFPPPFTIQLFGNDFLGAAIGPDGTPWGSFNADCGPTPDSPPCLANGGQTRGVVGRLVLR